jgi:hypothetical protein
MNYIIIETSEPFGSRDTNFVEETAVGLKRRGHNVTVFLLQNGVLSSRQNGCESYLARLVLNGVTVRADNFSLRERGIGSAELIPGIESVSIEALVDALVLDQTKAIWH